MTRLLTASIIAALPLVNAFSSTAPLVAWSSSRPLSHVGAKDMGAALDEFLLVEEVCRHDAVVLIDHPGLHASDLRTLSASSHLRRSLTSAVHARQLPYLPLSGSTSEGSLHSYASAIQTTCQSHVVSISLDDEPMQLGTGEKVTVVIDMPALHEFGEERKAKMEEHDSALAAHLTALLPPNHLVIYTGSALPSSSVFRRADSPSPSAALSFDDEDEDLPAARTGGILASYQLLSPALIMSILVVAFLLLPLVGVAVRALVSVQVPTMKAEAPKGWSASEKKNQ